MEFTRNIAIIGLAISFSFITVGSVSAQTSAEPPPAPSAPPAASTAPAPPRAAPAAAADTGNLPIKPMHERYLLSHNSAVYAQADTSSAVIAHLHRKKHVTVTGLQGDWLQVRLAHGKVGYIPTKAAE